MKNLLVFCVIIAFITSCSIQKRTYKKGYFVQWNLKKKVNFTASSTEDIQKEGIYASTDEPFLSSISDEPSNIPAIKKNYLEENSIQVNPEIIAKEKRVKRNFTKAFHKINPFQKQIKRIKVGRKAHFFPQKEKGNSINPVAYFLLSILSLVLGVICFVLSLILIWGNGASFIFLFLFSIALFVLFIVFLVMAIVSAVNPSGGKSKRPNYS